QRDHAHADLPGGAPVLTVVPTRLSPPVAIAIALPLLLAVTVAAIAITARVRGIGEPPPPDTGPLAVAPVESPDASSPECTALLRCGIPRPAELSPTSPLLEVNGVRWLQLDDGLPEPVQVSYIAVDRPVYVALTLPVDAGSAPLQHVSDVVRETLPATAVAVR